MTQQNIPPATWRPEDTAKALMALVRRKGVWPMTAPAQPPGE